MPVLEQHGIGVGAAHIDADPPHLISRHLSAS
jgi:hypothetical protein